jgi:hypothetical protein
VRWYNSFLRTVFLLCKDLGIRVDVSVSSVSIDSLLEVLFLVGKIFTVSGEFEGRGEIREAKS